MPTPNLDVQQKYSFEIGFTILQRVIDNNDWEYMEFVPSKTNDYLGVFPPVILEKNFFLDIGTLIRDPIWNWTIELRSTYLQYSKDQSGMRGLQIALAQYDQSAPQAEWEEEDYGNFVGWYLYLTNFSVPANPDAITTVPDSRAPYPLYKKIIPEGHTVFVAVLGMQNSPIPLEVINGDANFVFSRIRKAVE